MATFLETVVDHTRQLVDERRAALSEADLRARMGAVPRNRPFSEALVSEGISLIAEMKRSSPSKGAIRPDAGVTEIVTAYQDAGASAVSVLTEPKWFGGSLDDLAEARAALELPILRKDFIVDEYQLLEARAYGADAALLIVAALDPENLAHLLRFGFDLGLDLLVEVHDGDEVATAVDAGAEIIGVNNRNLHSLEVDLETSFRLLADVPAGTTVVAESGISHREDVMRLEEAGVDAILVGETLMRYPDPRDGVHMLLG